MAIKRATTPGFRDARYRGLISKLVSRRHELQLTQQALAEVLGLHKQFVSRYELGERRLDVVEFVDVASALGMEPSTLISTVPPSKHR